jgi:hypothetical protein
MEPVGPGTWGWPTDGELRVTARRLGCPTLSAACPARADALEYGQHTGNGRGQVPSTEMGLDRSLAAAASTTSQPVTQTR